MKPLDRELVNLAWECVHSKKKQIDFGEGTDYQGELHLSWNGNKFQAFIIVFSDPHTTGGFFYDPPETHWREEEDEFEAVKIRDVADWLKRDWGFELAPTNPPNNALTADPQPRRSAQARRRQSAGRLRDVIRTPDIA